MKSINNNHGASFILFTIMMGAILLALLGAVFGSMYNAQNHARQLRAGINAQIILQQLGSNTLQAYRDNIIGCPGGTNNTRLQGHNGTSLFCFPTVSGPGTGICVPHPISGETLICEGDASPMFQPMVVNQGVASIDVELPLKQKMNFLVAKLYRRTHKLISYMISKSKYLSAKLEAEIIIPVSFAGASAPTTLDKTCPVVGTNTRCKVCSETPLSPTSKELPCMRFRVCPHYGGCDPADDNEWIVQKVGILVGAPNP